MSCYLCEPNGDLKPCDKCVRADGLDMSAVATTVAYPEGAVELSVTAGEQGAKAAFSYHWKTIGPGERIAICDGCEANPDIHPLCPADSTCEICERCQSWQFLKQSIDELTLKNSKPMFRYKGL